MKEEGIRTIGLLILLMAACVATVPSPSTASEVATAPSPSTAREVLQDLIRVGRSKSYYWVWCRPWRASAWEAKGERRNTVMKDGRFEPAPLERTKLELSRSSRLGDLPPSWRAHLYYDDLGTITGSWNSSAFYAANRASATAVIRKAWKDHRAVCIFSWHADGPCVTNGFKETAAYRFRCTEHPNVFRAILDDEQWLCGAGSRDPNQKNTPTTPRRWFLKQLDDIVDFFNGLTDEDGRPIPVIFRYAHEMEDSWQWWGRKFCTRDEYVRLMRFVADTLRRRCGADRLLFLYSPDRYWKDFGAEGDGGGNYLSWYPGDGYVDIIGYDDYSIGQARKGQNKEKVKTVEQRAAEHAESLRKMRLISAFADAHGKAACLAESGVDGSEDYFARMAELLADEQVHFAFFTTWCGRWFEPATPTAVEDRRFFLEKAPLLIDKGER